MAASNDDLQGIIPDDILDLYEVYSYRNAAQVLIYGCATEFSEILEGLRAFRLTLDDIRKRGGNESEIPKRIAGLLRAKGWQETRIKGDLVLDLIRGKARGRESDDESEVDTEQIIEESEKSGRPVDRIRRRNFVDGHKIDFLKGKVAFDVEWNSKDQTFDRDLYAFRAFHEYQLIDAAVILTRSESLDPVFVALGPELDDQGQPLRDRQGHPKFLKAKYGASTTWMGKLTYRLDAGRHGGCPVLALGITPKLITDWPPHASPTP